MTSNGASTSSADLYNENFEIKNEPIYEEAVDTSKVWSQFLLSQGLPFETVNDSGFKRLFDQLLPNQPYPDEASVEEASKYETNGEIDLEFVEPISVSMDIQVNPNNEKYCVFSAHFIDNTYTRTNAVFFKKFKEPGLDSTKLWAAVTEGLLSNNYINVKLSNAVFASTNVAKSFTTEMNIETRNHICLFYLLNKFIREMIEHVDIEKEVLKIGVYIDLAKKNLTASEFENIFQNVAAPRRDDSLWLVSSGNLSKWMKAYETLQPPPPYLSSRRHDFEDAYQKMGFVLNVLQLCYEKAHLLSKPESMLSQVLPSIIAIRRCISDNVETWEFAKRIEQQLNATFIMLRSEHYSLATLLDPRYAYDHYIYNEKHWKRIEHALQESTPETASEIPFYRKFAESARAKYGSVDLDPLQFWADAESRSLKNLAKMAREYLASPAVAVDASHFFNKTTGKFSRICDTYKNEKLDEYLKAAAAEQDFIGKGAFAMSMCLEAQQPPNRYQPRGRAPVKRSAPMTYVVPVKRSVYDTIDHNADPYETAEYDDNVPMENPSPPPFVMPLVERKPEQLHFNSSSSASGAGIPVKEIKQEITDEPEPELIETKPPLFSNQSLSFSNGIVPKEEPIDEYEEEDLIIQHRESTSNGSGNVGNQNQFKLPTIQNPMQGIKEDEDEEFQLSSSWNLAEPPQHAKLRGRYCGQCDRNDKPMKLMQSKDDLLLLLVCAVRHKNLSFIDAVKQFRRNHPLFCVEHCQETCNDVFTIFNVGRPEDISNLPLKAFKANFMDICKAICNGSMDITKEYMKEACFKFTARYIREPCIMCSERLYRKEMFSVSKEAASLTSWFDQKWMPFPPDWIFEGYFGEELTNILREDTMSYICMDHFPKTYYSKHGRRLLNIDKTAVFQE